MPIYRKNEDGTFAPFNKTRMPDLEKRLEDWVERNPEILLGGEQLVIIARQAGTGFGKIADLLAVDESGACIIIELKKGRAPREIIAQTLEYAAWVDSLTRDDLDAIAREYAGRHALGAQGVAELYEMVFAGPSEEEGGETSDADLRVTFNTRQRMVMVAEEFPGEMEQTLRYLRARLGVDISAVRFALHQLAGETLIETEVVVGRETPAAAADKAKQAGTIWSADEIRERVDSDFLRETVDSLPEWILEHLPDATIQRNRASGSSVYHSGSRVLSYYFALRWLHFWLPNRTDDDLGAFANLTNPHSVAKSGTGVSGNVVTAEDLELLKLRILARLVQT